VIHSRLDPFLEQLDAIVTSGQTDDEHVTYILKQIEKVVQQQLIFTAEHIELVDDYNQIGFRSHLTVNVECLQNVGSRLYGQTATNVSNRGHVIAMNQSVQSEQSALASAFVIGETMINCNNQIVSLTLVGFI
jgi:primosomal protein N'